MSSPFWLTTDIVLIIFFSFSKSSWIFYILLSCSEFFIVLLQCFVLFLYHHSSLNSNFDIEKTLNENWDKIDNNAKEIEKQVNGKIDKVEGKELSTNDFTSNYKEKLENLENYDDTEIKQSIEEVTIKNS